MNVFQHHDRDFENNAYVYPVVSRRSRGISIGVDLTHERCTFRCVYCSELAKREGALVDEGELARSEDAPCDGNPGPARGSESSGSTPTPLSPSTISPCGLKLAKDIDLERLEREIRSMVRLIASGELVKLPRFQETPAAFRRLNDIALSGSGEPTLSPTFDGVCRLVRRLGEEARSRGLWSEPKAVLITNATALHLKRVQDGLEALGPMLETWAKLDGGTPERYQAMNRSLVPFHRVLENLMREGRRRPLFIQTMFGVLDGRPPTEGEMAAWMDRIRELVEGGAQVRGVQMYTVARAPKGGVIQPLADGELMALAKVVRDRLGLPVAWFGGSGGMGELP